MKTCMAGGSSSGILILVVLLVAGISAAGAQQSTPRKPAGAGGNGGSASGAASGSAANSASTGKSSGNSGTEVRRSTSPGSVASPLQFSQWLGSSTEGRRYESVSSRVQELSGSAKEAGVPYEVFMVRMKEAMAKNVDPGVFVKALESDSVQWLRIAALLGENDWPPAAKAPDFYIAAGAALRNGVSEESISTLVTWALSSKGTPERAGAVLMSVSSLTGVMDTAGLSQTAGLIASSRLRVGEFDDLAVLLKRASAAGRSTAELLAAMEAVLGNRNALRNLERRLLP